jgi:YVTN family beta-propeller protein
VACFSTNDVRAISPDLATRGPTRKAGAGPIALATLGADTWAANSLSGSLSRLPVDLAAAPTEYLLRGSDFEYITSHAGRLLVSNAGAGTVVVVDPASGAAVAEVPVGASAGENIKGIAFAQVNAVDTAFVSLQGDAVGGNPALGQKVALLDASRLSTCGLAGSPLPCLGAPTYLDVSAGADAPGLAFPGRSVASGGKVYVVLANLKKGSFGYFTDPAGPGKLAVIDPSGPSVSYLSLGAACGNPGGLALRGASAWVACGTGGLVEVALGGLAPAVSGVHPTPGFMVPGNVAFCGDHGFVTDQYSGDVYPFDPVNFPASPAAATTVCPASAGQFGYAWAADVACAIRP